MVSLRLSPMRLSSLGSRRGGGGTPADLFTPASLFASGGTPLPIVPVSINGVGDVAINPADAISAALTVNAGIVNGATYYVKPSTGSDSNNGSIDSPFATVVRAMRTATGQASRVVMLEDCVIPSFDLRNTDASQSSQQFKWLDANGFNVVIRDTVADLAAQTWTQDGTYPNWWKTALTVTGSQALKRVLRTDQTDSEGYPKSLLKLTAAPSSNDATPAFYWDATGGVAWVNLGGGSVEADKSTLKGLFVNGAGTSRILVIGASLGLAGIRLEGVQLVSLDGGARRPEIWLHNCEVLWSVSKGWDGTKAGWLVATDTIFHSSEADCLNAFAPSVTGKGLICTANCRFSFAGDVNVFPANGTLQGTSAHGGSNHAGFANVYVGNNGQGVADTCANNAEDITWLVGCEVIGGNSSTPNYAFGSVATAASRKAYLDTCASSGALAVGDLAIGDNATVYTRNTTLGSVSGGSVVPY